MVVNNLQKINYLQQYKPFTIASILMFFAYGILSVTSTAWIMQIPSGYIASIFLGAIL